MSAGTMGTAVLAYAARGWHTFVLSASKSPMRNCDLCRAEHSNSQEMEACTCLTCHGFYAATTDPARITEMLRRHPGGMLAVRTGAVSGLAVVDVDIKTFDGPLPAADDPGYVTMSGLDRERLLPGTLMQSTGSGGLHFLYGHPGGYLLSGAGKYGPGVDSKADGGYIVVAPSVSQSGPYLWTGDGGFDDPLTPLPEPLATRLRPAEPAEWVKGPVTPWTRPGVSTGRLAGLLRVVLEAPAGERNDRLHWAASKAGEMVAAGEIAKRLAVAVLTDAGIEVGLTVAEIGHATKGTIGSGLRKGRVAA